ncbi:MAG: PG0541 family transporter-associated protein [Myxococcota bacterium]
MKLVHITFQFQFTDAVEAMLAEHHVGDYVQHPRAVGHDRDGRHDGSQAFPGHLTTVEALVDDPVVPALLDDLRRFRDAKPAHAHLRAVVLPVEDGL